jgi:hypothetical protein
MITTNRETLRKIIEDCAMAPTQWANHAVPFVPPGATARTGATFNPTATTPTIANLDGKTRLVMRISSSKDHGHDEPRRDYNPAGAGTLTEFQSGLRHYTLSITCIAYGAEAPAEILELLRTRLQRTTYRQRMRAIDVAIVDMLGIVDIPTLHSPVATAGLQAVLDIKLVWAMNDSLGPQDFIETVEEFDVNVDS